MANIKFTCEEKKGIKSCDSPRREFVLGNIHGVLCERCYGTVDYRIEKHEKQEKPKKEAQVKPRPEKAAEEKPVKAVLEVPKPVEIPTQQETVADVKDPYIIAKQLVEQGSSITDVLLMLKKDFGMSNSEAAKYYKENFHQPKEESAPVVPAPLPQAEAKQREESSVKPPLVNAKIEEAQIVEEVVEKTPVQKGYPITKVEFVDEATSYRIFMVTEDGIEFKLLVKASEEKYAKGKSHPHLFHDAVGILEFTDTDSTEIPLNPKFIRMEKAKATA